MADKYRVLVEYLRYPANAAELAKRIKGDPDVKWKVAKRGSIQEDIPPTSIAPLLEQGKIEKVGPKEKAPEPESDEEG